MASRPIPLSQLQGGGRGGGGGWMMILLVCCISSIISAIVGFVFREQLSKMMGGSMAAPVTVATAAAAPVTEAAGTPKSRRPAGRGVVKGRKLKIRRPRKIGRGAKKIRRPKKIGRGVRKVGRVGKKGVKAVGRAIKKPSRAIKKIGRGVRKVGRAIKKPSRAIKGLFRRRRCFAPETLVKLQNGNEVAMKDLKLGDVLINGSIVNGVMNILNETNPYYKIHSSELDRDIFVTGSHYIKDGNVYKAVKNFSRAEVTTKIDREVSCLITSDHKIPVGEFVFWDWEDDKIQP